MLQLMPGWFANVYMGSNIKSLGDSVVKPVCGWLRLSKALPVRSCPLKAYPLLHRWLIRADSSTYGHSGLYKLFNFRSSLPNQIQIIYDGL